MKNLFVCNTPYQIIVATQLRITLLENQEVDLIISDDIANSNILFDNIKKSNIFNSVYLLRVKGVSFTDISLKISKKANENLAKKILGDMDFNLSKVKTYTKYFFCNLGGHSNCIGRYIKSENKNVKIAMFEDGFSSYDRIYRDVINKEKEKSFKANIKKSINPSSVFLCEEYYLFHPHLLKWDPQCNVVSIPQIKKEKTTVKIFNEIFGYNNYHDQYDKKVIFFEESYFADGIPIDDFKIVEEIASVIGRDNIYIKIHPRNYVNRFKEAGYETNTNTFIPWEVIALNLELEDKILISIASGSFLTSYCITGIAPLKGIMLMDLEEFRDVETPAPRKILKDICLTNTSVFKCPSRKEELKNELVR